MWPFVDNRQLGQQLPAFVLGDHATSYFCSCSVGQDSTWRLSPVTLSDAFSMFTPSTVAASCHSLGSTH